MDDQDRNSYKERMEKLLCLALKTKFKKSMIAFLKFPKGCHIEEGQDLFSVILNTGHKIMDLSYMKANSN